MNNQKVDFSKYKNATTNLQKSDLDTVVFYKLHTGTKAMNVLLERLKKVKVGLLILQTDQRVSLNVNNICVDEQDFYGLQHEVCDQLYPKSLKPKLIGITGTNGKSTVCHLVAQLIKAEGLKCATIGTIGVMDGDSEIYPAPEATTPSYVELRKILHCISDYDFVALEVSSHALDQKRLGSLRLDAIGWTNLTQDHLDYHNTMEEYLTAKALIRDYSTKTLLVSNEQKLLADLKKASVSFEVAEDITIDECGVSFRLDYNRKNLSLAKALVESALNKKVEIPTGLSLPKGRYNSFVYKNSIFVVDYAHTPDAIENLVRETKRAFPDFMLITLFGCGGDRDATKRPKMLNAALSSSDKVVVTTDNPRTEDPNKIIEDIVKGSDPSKFEVIVDRKEAISNIVKDYSEKTICLIAGKGHEEYQEVNGEKRFFSDIEEVKKNIEKLS